MNLAELYDNESLEYQETRYRKLLESFGGAEGASLYSAPGRAEIGGNHTDHQRGRVLAAAIDKDIICAAVKAGNIELNMEGYGRLDIDLNGKGPAKHGTTEALVLGVLDYFTLKGYSAGGFRANIQSGVKEGSGLSSSAAFSNLIGTVLNYEYNDRRIPPIEIAKAGRHAENNFFGKPSGLMDQTASAVGGFVYIDFGPEEPLVERIDFSPKDFGITVCVVHTGGSHADMTRDYADITSEMRAVAGFLGQEVLGFCEYNELVRHIPEIRRIHGDRAVLRAMHFFNETVRVLNQADCLKNGDIDCFLDHVRKSGLSSISCLQNIYRTASPESQPLSLALAAAGQILRESGACRVHGGGFAGTILAFVPNDLYGVFEESVEAVVGAGSVSRLGIRSAGAVKVK